MKNARTTTRALASAALLAFSAQTVAAEPFPCFHPEEQQSARIHDLQIMLMVGALQCRDRSPRNVARYGDMLSSRDGGMTAHADRLLGRLIEEYGYREGRRIFDAYETSLSNYYADQQLSSALCADFGTYVRMAEDATDAELETLSKLASRRHIATCAQPLGAARVIPPRAEPWAAEEREQRRVRVFRGVTPPQVAAETARAAEFPDMVSAPVAEPRIENAAFGARQATVAQAAASASAAEAAAAEVEVAAVPAAEPDQLQAAIQALESAASALRDLRERDDSSE